jgi:amidase
MQVPIAFGTQTNGSVIRPAGFCGVCGFKGSYGWTDPSGIFCMVKEFDTLGIYTRNFDDTWNTFSALVGQVPRPLAAVGTPPKIAIWHHQGWSDMEPASAAAMEQATHVLESLGATVLAIAMPAIYDDVCDQHGLIIHDGLARGLAGKTSGVGTTPAHHGEDKYHMYTWHGGSRWPMITEGLLEMVETGLTANQTAVDAAYAKMALCRERLNAVLDEGGFDAFLSPTGPGEAPLGRHTGNAIFCTPWSYLGTPSAAVPGLKGPAGMPVGVQFNGRHGGDETVLALAKWLQDHIESPAYPRKPTAPASAGSKL